MPEAPRPNIVDRSLKELARQAPGAFLRLLGVDVGEAPVRPSDVSVNLPEFRADQLFLIGEEDNPERWALHLEYQLQPDARALRGWFLKNAGFTRQLQIPVLLVALYLTRGERASFPAVYGAAAGGLTNEFRFHTICLWEHADRIRSGELRELAPLLILCEEEPSVETLFEERDLILASGAPRSDQAEMISLAISLAARHFDMPLLREIFREEMEMIREVTFIDEWIQEAEERGRIKGEEAGEDRGARDVLLRLMRRRFGEVPVEAMERVQALSKAECENLTDRLLEVETLSELGL